jgi:probable F420-dependent oxidoreductase
MEFDLMTAGSTWSGNAELAQQVEGAGFSGMLWTEIHQVPWMQIAAAAMAAPSLTFTTGIAVAFPRSPMLTAQVAWELAGNTGGRFRLGLGSQVKAHITRRYATTYDKPAERMRDYVAAVKACLRAFRGEEKLSHDGPFYQLTLLPGWAVPPGHQHGHVKVDISAVGPLMVKVAAELADGVHVHPLHSMPYLHNRLLPSLAEGAKGVGRDPAEIDLIVPVFIVPGDSPEEREALARRARGQIAFYGTTPNYSFQFDDLGYEGMTAKLGERLRAGDTEGMADLITDEMLDHFAVVGTWDDVAAKLRDRYGGVAARVVSYLGEDQIRSDPAQRARWAELARAVRG